MDDNRTYAYGTKESLSDADKFYAIDEDGNIVQLLILFTYDDDVTGYSYVVYTDESMDEAGNENVYVSRYTEEDGNTQLQDIETEEEWKKAEVLLKHIVSEIQG